MDAPTPDAESATESTSGFKSSYLMYGIAGLCLLLVAHAYSVRHDAPSAPTVAYLGAGSVSEVTLTHNQLGQYVTIGRINGQPVQFLVDTGSVDIAMPYALARQLNLELRSGGVSKTGNGNVASWRAWLDTVDVGGLAVRNVKAVVLPNMPGQEVLLGMGYLSHMDVHLAGGQMTLRHYAAE